MKRRLEPILRTQRLTLRPFDEADLDAIVAGVGDVAVSRLLARVPHPYRRSDGEAFLTFVRASARTGSDLPLAIEHQGKLIGGISIDKIPRRCELGYWIAKPVWGRGFATEAASAILEYGFGVLRLPLVRSGFFTANTGSRRVQEKLGFRPVGTGKRLSLAQGTEVEHIDTVLLPARFRHVAR